MLSTKHTAIILAGGHGSRLQSITGQTPKCLAPVNGQPFLYYLLQQLSTQGFAQIVLALGVGAEAVQTAAAAWQQYHPQVTLQYVIETSPLGTGGAILHAIPYCQSQHVLVLNGDSYLQVNYADTFRHRPQMDADVTMLLTPMQQADRFGLVTMDAQKRIISFQEKKAHSSGLINAGAYWLNIAKIHPALLPPIGSWEKDILPMLLARKHLYGQVVHGYFIDIGIPDAYEKAQKDFAKFVPMIQPAPNWTLFLDRDGVINIEKENDYIHHWNEFQFYQDAIDAIAAFSQLFERIIVVTNQKGVGKGVTLRENVEDIHHRMTAAIAQGGGRIDAIYYCPDTDSNSPNRKPNAGMAFQAKTDFPSIHFQQSVMIGNNLSDLYFGRNAGMHTVLLRTTQPLLKVPVALADMESPSLSHLVKVWQPSTNSALC